MMAFRAFFLYNRMPYDRSMFSKFRDPWTLLLTYLAASTNVWVRGSFFTIYLLCIGARGRGLDRHACMRRPRTAPRLTHSH